MKPPVDTTPLNHSNENTLPLHSAQQQQHTHVRTQVRTQVRTHTYTKINPSLKYTDNKIRVQRFIFQLFQEQRFFLNGEQLFTSVPRLQILATTETC